MGLAVIGVALIAALLAKLVMTPDQFFEPNQDARSVASTTGSRQPLMQMG